MKYQIQKYSILVLSLCFLLFFPVEQAFSQTANNQAAVSRRIGLFIGANDAGSQLPNLVWAVRDSQRMGDLMQELGGMKPEDRLSLQNPDSKEIKKAFTDILRKVEESKTLSRRTELVFYYSGHSDTEGLLLKDGRLEYQDIRDWLKQTQADVSIAILDSCSSGSFTRTKGGARIKPFLFDDSINMKGYAFITSSSVDEAAQESDRLEGSFFTHHMISGLRGAADRNNDGRVSLNEAYEFAFQETLHSTGTTLNGPQHPSYDIQLQGSGDLVLSDLSDPSASLTLSSGLEGRLYLRDETNKLILELSKSRGTHLALALPSGRYTVNLESTQASLEATIQLRYRQNVVLDIDQLKPIQKTPSRSRGEDTKTQENSEVSEDFLTAAEDFTKTDEDSEVDLSALSKEMSEAIIADVKKKKKQDSSELNKEAEAQNTPPKDSLSYYPINLSFVPGLSVFPDGKDTLSNIVVSPLIAASGSNYGFMLAGIGSISYAQERGLQASGIFNISQSLEGAQTAGIFNTIQESSRGIQLAGIYNNAEADFSGAQLSGIWNTSAALKGTQISGIFNSSADLHGIQLSGIFNTATEVHGGQVSGIFNISEDFYGIQSAGIFNSSKDFYGVQAAGIFNLSGDFHGVQASSILNIAGDAAGVQIGLINYGKSLDGLPLGLLNIYEEGIHDLTYWYTPEDRMWLSISTGNEIFYGSIFTGFLTDSGLEDLQGFSLGVSSGFRLKADLFYIDTNFNIQHYQSLSSVSSDQFWADFSSNLVPGIKLTTGLDFDFIQIFAGLQLNCFFNSFANIDDYSNSEKDLRFGNSEILFQLLPLLGLAISI